jgi:ParB family transcriptional regulator, chromosome partitioning protein
VVRRAGLGRGLGALIPAEAIGAAGAFLDEIPVEAIEPNPNQPRVHFDEASLADLAASIQELGVLQPVLVRRLGAGRYQLIAGERRWRAARRAGLADVPAIIRDADDLSSVEQALVENLHRADLTPLEEASAYQQLIEDFALTHEQVATRVGKSRAAVTNTLRLLQLAPSIQHLLADGRLSAGHARALLGSSDRAYQEQLARRAAAEGWSVRAVEDAVRARLGAPALDGPATSSASATPPSPLDAPPSGPGTSRLRPPGVLELEGLLSDYLATRVTVKLGGGTGKVVVEFADLADLERIYRCMTEGAGQVLQPADEG